MLRNGWQPTATRDILNKVSSPGVVIQMDKRPVALYLACAGELAMVVIGGGSLAFATVGPVIALLGIAGCMQLGRGWGARIAALGFLAQAAWIVPHAPGALPIAALAVTAVGLSVAANVAARERLGAACVASRAADRHARRHQRRDDMARARRG